MSTPQYRGQEAPHNFLLQCRAPRRPPKATKSNNTVQNLKCKSRIQSPEAETSNSEAVSLGHQARDSFSFVSAVLSRGRVLRRLVEKVP